MIRPRISPEFARFVRYSVGAVTVVSIPVGVWWYSAYQTRQRIAHEVATRIRLPGFTSTDDYLIEEKCRPGDLVIFDRRPETCAAGPWAALACVAAKTFLCGQHPTSRYVAEGNFDHVGIIVPGFARSKGDEFDPSNLVLLEATPQGIVARSLKTRLERSQSRSVMLLQLNVPGERRDFDKTKSPYVDDDNDDDDSDESNNSKSRWRNQKAKKKKKEPSSRELMVQRTRQHVEQELVKYRDTFLALNDKYHFKWMYSTLTMGGAILYGLGIATRYKLSGPVSPSAWLVVMGLQQAAAAQNIDDQAEQLRIKPEDFVRPTAHMDETNPLRLRPGWRFLAPISLRERNT